MILQDSIAIKEKSSLVQAIIELSKNYEDVCLLNSNNYNDPVGKFELIAGLGCKRRLSLDQIFKIQPSETKEWMFIHMAYDLKNKLENLSSHNQGNIQFEDISAFVPKYFFKLEKNSSKLEIFSHTKNDDGISEKLQDLLGTKPNKMLNEFPEIHSSLTKAEYLQKIETIKQHIQKGDIYEANFCMEFFAENAEISPEACYHLLNFKSPSPFSSFYKQKGSYLISASPERFLAKRGQKIISQPMKGTIQRGKTLQEDEKLKKHLQNDRKEQTENVMIVDVVRNDLSRIAEKGSVKVDELFGIYTFPQVHQMISTVSCYLKENTSMGEIIKATFPMASMTGAPKISAMKILDEQELKSRNLYSGSIGYISPGGDFDCNVIIRSLLYNKSKKHLSYSTGGAITAMSIPEMEYKECLLKAKAIFGK